MEAEVEEENVAKRNGKRRMEKEQAKSRKRKLEMDQERDKKTKEGERAFQVPASRHKLTQTPCCVGVLETAFGTLVLCLYLLVPLGLPRHLNTNASALQVNI